MIIDTEIFHPHKYLPYSQKKKNDWEWLEKVSLYYEYFNNTDKQRNKIHRNYQMNYDLYNGKCDLNKYVENCNPFELQMVNLDPSKDFGAIKHHPVIDTVAKAIVGEQRRRPLNAMIYNTNMSGINQRRRKKSELLREYMDKKIIDPIRQKVTMEYMQENNIQDPFSLNDQQQQQMQADIGNRTQAQTPKEILEYMRVGYKTPEDKQLDTLYNYLRKHLDLKFVTDQAFEDFIITGLEVYHVDIRNNEPFVEVCNPMGLDYYLPPDKMFIEDSEWITYKSEITYSDILTRYKLTSNELKKLDKINFLGNATGYENMKHIRDSRIISVVADTEYENINPKTREGQRELQDLYEKFGGSMVNSFTHTKTVIRGSRKLYVAKRYDDKTDSFIYKFFGENYKRSKKDIEVTERIVPELYTVSKVGEGAEAVFLNKGPVPFQYPSLDNPFNPKMPFVGIEYSRLHQNTNNVAPMDPGKPWQFRLNVEMYRLDEALATDIGNVLLFNAAGLPQNWDLDKFFSYMRNKKIAPVDFSKEGIGPFDAQLFKEVNLSNSQQIQERIGFIEYLRNQIALSMSYNLSRLGLVDRYTAVSNNQQNIIQSSLQTETIYAVHNKAVENMLNKLMDTARVAYKDNPIKTSYILDDMSIADLTLDSEMLWRSEIGAFLSNESDDTENLRMTKELLLPLIQNQMISSAQAIKLIWSKSASQALEVAESAEEKLQQMREQEQQFQQQMLAAQQQMQEKLKAQEDQVKLLMQDKDHANEQFIAGVNSTTLAKQFDIDGNNQNDMKEIADADREFDREKLDKELASKEKINSEDNKTKKEIAKSQKAIQKKK